MSAPYQLLPPLTDQEYADLKADIVANGIEQSIIVDDLGQIIDGHHRAQIAEELGLDYPVEVRVIDSEDAKRDLALRLNVHRRSLTREQKRELLANLIKASPEKSDRQHAAAAGVDHKTAGAVRDELEGRGEIPHVDERTDTLGRNQPAKVTFRKTESETHDYTSPGSPAPTGNAPSIAGSVPAPDVEPEPGAPAPSWTDDELNLRDDLINGKTIVVNMRADAHARLWAWAEQAGYAERIDRRSRWGNPFTIGEDGDRDQVIGKYVTYYLPHKPALIADMGSLKGKALGCWCAPERCHGDTLKAGSQ